MFNSHSRRYENRLLLLLSLMFGFVFFDRSALSFLVPFFEKELHLNNTKIGLLNSVLAFSWAISGYLAGWLSDRTGRRKTYLLMAVAVFSLCSFLSGFAGSFGWLLACRLLLGAAEGPVIPLSQSLMLINSKDHRRGFNIGMVQGFVSNVFIMLTPVILVQIAVHYGWRYSFFVSGIPGLILVVIGYFLIKEYPGGITPATKQNSNIGQLLDVRNIRLSILLGSCMMIWLFSQLSFLPKYLVTIKHFSLAEMGYVMPFVGIAGVIWGVALPWLSDRYGRRLTVMIASLLSIIMPLGLPLSAPSALQIVFLILIGGAILGALPIALTMIPAETVSREFIAQSIGLVVGFSEITGGFLAPAGVGFIADKHGLTSVFYIAAGAALAAAILSYFIVETAPALNQKKP